VTLVDLRWGLVLVGDGRNDRSSLILAPWLLRLSCFSVADGEGGM